MNTTTTYKNALAEKAAKLKMVTLLVLYQELNPEQALAKCVYIIKNTVIIGLWRELLKQTSPVSYDAYQNGGLLGFWVEGNEAIPNTTTAEKLARAFELFDILAGYTSGKEEERIAVFQSLLEYIFGIILADSRRTSGDQSMKVHRVLVSDWRLFLEKAAKFPTALKKVMDAHSESMCGATAFWLAEYMCDSDKSDYGPKEWTQALSITSAALWRVIAHARGDRTLHFRRKIALLWGPMWINYLHPVNERFRLVNPLPDEDEVWNACIDATNRICSFAQKLLNLSRALHQKAPMLVTVDFGRSGSKSYGDDPWRFFGFSDLVSDLHTAKLSRIVFCIAMQHPHLPREIEEKAPLVKAAADAIVPLVEVILADIGFGDPIELLIATRHDRIPDICYVVNRPKQKS